jgi:hypothetical protein
MVVYLLIKEAGTARKLGLRSYFLESAGAVWNCYEVVFFSVVCWMLYTMYSFRNRTTIAEETLKLLRAMPGSARSPVPGEESSLLDETFVDMRGFKSEFRSFFRVLSYAVTMSIFKVFKYTGLSVRLNFMWRIILRARGELWGFLVIFVLLLGGFSFLGCTLFGHEVRDFHNWASSFMSLLRYVRHDSSHRPGLSGPDVGSPLGLTRCRLHACRSTAFVSQRE